MATTLNGMTVPSWASHVEDKLAPMPLLLVQAYVDTLDRDLGTDIFARADEACAWLADAGLRDRDRDRDRPGREFAEDLGLVREVRESIRALIGHTNADEPLAADDLAPLELAMADMLRDGTVARLIRLHYYDAFHIPYDAVQIR